MTPLEFDAKVMAYQAKIDDYQRAVADFVLFGPGTNVIDGEFVRVEDAPLLLGE